MAKKKSAKKSDARSAAETLDMFEQGLRNALNTPPDKPREAKKKTKRRKS